VSSGEIRETARRKCIRYAEHDLRELKVTRWRGKGNNREGWVFATKRTKILRKPQIYV
jgi:hypothetical protein